MKSLFITLILFSSSAFACPKLSGSWYSCLASNGAKQWLEDNTVSQRKIRGITEYTFTTRVDGGPAEKITFKDGETQKVVFNNNSYANFSHHCTPTSVVITGLYYKFGKLTNSRSASYKVVDGKLRMSGTHADNRISLECP